MGSPAVSTNGRSGQGFRRTQRILRTREFTRVMRDGARSGERLFAIHYLSTGQTQARIGIAVGRRVATRAVRRNTIKRVLRECFRHEASRLPAYDIVIIVRSAAADVPNAELTRACRHALERLAQTAARSAPAPNRIPS